IRADGRAHCDRGDQDAVKAKMIKQTFQIVCLVPERVSVERNSTFGMPAPNIGEAFVRARKVRHLVLKQRRAMCLAMNEDQWRAVTCDFVIEVTVVYGDVRHALSQLPACLDLTVSALKVVFNQAL